MYRIRATFRRQRHSWRLPRGYLVCVIAFVLPGAAARSSADPEAGTVVEISVEGARPLADAVNLLEERYGWIITYEDAPYVHSSDVKDVTREVRRDLDESSQAAVARVLVPSGGRIDMTATISGSVPNQEDIAALVRKALDAHAENGNPGVFRLQRAGTSFHVIPSQVRTSAGQLAPKGSILDAAITISDKERDGVQTLEAICDAVAHSAGVRIGVGTIPFNMLRQTRIHLTASEESARSVLVRALAGMHRNVSWRLFYDPGLRLYVLNVHVVQTRERTPGPE